MAERRMFAKTIIDSDVFLDMPLSTQALYFHLAMRADDEGFINKPKMVMRMIGASQNEMELLLAKRYLLAFDSGVVVVKHWRIHNYIQKDRFKSSLYKEEREEITITKNNSYTEKDLEVMDTECVQDGYTGKVRLGKVSIGKVIKESAKSSRFLPPTVKEVQEYCRERINNVNPDTFIDFYTAKGWMIGKTKMKDWKAAVRTWEKNNYSDSSKPHLKTTKQIIEEMKASGEIL